MNLKSNSHKLTPNTGRNSAWKPKSMPIRTREIRANKVHKTCHYKRKIKNLWSKIERNNVFKGNQISIK